MSHSPRKAWSDLRSSLRKQGRVILAVGAAWLIVVTPAFNDPFAAGDSEDGEVKKVVAALRDAGLRRDVGALEHLYAPNYFHINPDGSTMEREQVLDSYRRKAPMTFTSVEADEWRSILRRSFAVVSERNSLHGRTADGHPFISRYRVTYLLERRNGSWQVLNSHASLLGIDKNPATP